MDMEDARISVALNEEHRQQELFKEFENLRPKWRTAYFNLIFGAALFPLLYWLFPQTAEQPAIMVILILVLGFNMNNFHESRRINKRIDLLQRMNKQDV